MVFMKKQKEKMWSELYSSDTHLLVCVFVCQPDEKQGTH